MEQSESEFEVTVFTDPLCCWSWVFEPQLQQIQKFLGKRAKWEYKMSGLLPSWKNFHDEINSVTRPVQMGPVWMHCGQITNMPINHQIWMKDPPASSYPACIAVKCAQLQSAEFGKNLLRLLRESCMIGGKNIARPEIIDEAAHLVHSEYPEFNLEKFKADQLNDNGIDAFRLDIDLVRRFNISRFPTLIIKSVGQKSVMVFGYRHYSELEKIFELFKSGTSLQGIKTSSLNVIG